tara:strand:+ start:1248 stop:1463 length:216 start_codon:yes stop_codon:yes gene_type:complete
MDVPLKELDSILPPQNMHNWDTIDWTNLLYRILVMSKDIRTQKSEERSRLNTHQGISQMSIPTVIITDADE